MSRIGKRPVDLPSGVEASLDGQTITIKGPKARLLATDDVTCRRGWRVCHAPRQLEACAPAGHVARYRQLVQGVTTGFKKELEIQGVGYRAQMQGNTLKLNLGLSHDVDFEVPRASR